MQLNDPIGTMSADIREAPHTTDEALNKGIVTAWRTERLRELSYTQFLILLREGHVEKVCRSSGPLPAARLSLPPLASILPTHPHPLHILLRSVLKCLTWHGQHPPHLQHTLQHPCRLAEVSCMKTRLHVQPGSDLCRWSASHAHAPVEWGGRPLPPAAACCMLLRATRETAAPFCGTAFVQPSVAFVYSGAVPPRMNRTRMRCMLWSSRPSRLHSPA